MFSNQALLWDVKVEDLDPVLGKNTRGGLVQFENTRSKPHNPLPLRHYRSE